MEPRYEITRDGLAKALQEWEGEALANKWAERNDQLRHRDAAVYLIEKMGFRI